VQVLLGKAQRTIRTVAGTLHDVRPAADRAGYPDSLQQAAEQVRPGAVVLAERVGAPDAEPLRVALGRDERFAVSELPLRGGSPVAVWWPQRRAGR
jgi:hypothetical protein